MTAVEVSPKEMDKVAAKKKEKKEKKDKSEKKEKKEKKKRKREASGSDQDDEDHQMKEKDDSNSSRMKKRDKRQELLTLVPERDEDGIVYTKLQRRRMMKRVKRGLPPVPTPEEEDERRKNEAQLKREEEEELSGMIYNREKVEKDDDSDADENEENQDDNVDDEGIDEENPNERTSSTKDESIVFDPSDDNKASMPPAKKSKRSKPVPVDYVCQACKNQHTPIHWIYDCPDKVTMRGTNQISKKVRGVHDPDAKKVFVSGLPFETKRKDIDQMFASCGKMVHCKLLTFEDTGRCKGQAYLTFDTEDGAKKAIALSGTVIDHVQEKTKKTTESKRKELRLKVTKMLNRSATKQGSRA